MCGTIFSEPYISMLLFPIIQVLFNYLIQLFKYYSYYSRNGGDIPSAVIWLYKFPALVVSSLMSLKEGSCCRHPGMMLFPQELLLAYVVEFSKSYMFVYFCLSCCKKSLNSHKKMALFVM